MDQKFIRFINKWFALIFIACAVLAAAMSVSATVESPPRPRFEELHYEELDRGTFLVFHDREAGLEIVCRRAFWGTNASTESCWTTGRTWK